MNDRYPIVYSVQISDFKYDILIICLLYYEQIIEKLGKEEQIDLKKWYHTKNMNVKYVTGLFRNIRAVKIQK